MEPVPVPDAKHNLEIQVLARWAVLQHNVSITPVSGVKYGRVLKATKQQLLPSVKFKITLVALSHIPVIPPLEVEYLAEIEADRLDNKLELLQFVPANRDASPSAADAN